MNTFLLKPLKSMAIFGVGISLSTSVLLFAKNVHAQNDQLKTLMLANNCMACHMIDKRKYGPQFNEVAEKYADKKDAVSYLATKIKKGGSGVWGEDMMPPQASVTTKDAKAIAGLIMALKPTN